MKKSIAIIGEGETEWFYFESLRIADAIRSSFLQAFRNMLTSSIY